MESADYSMQLCIFPLGRVARAGRSGTAYSLVGSDEVRLNTGKGDVFGQIVSETVLRKVDAWPFGNATVVT